jgi:hypothetical protein
MYKMFVLSAKSEELNAILYHYSRAPPHDYKIKNVDCFLNYQSRLQQMYTFLALCCSALQKHITCSMSPVWVFSRCTSKLCISWTASANCKMCFEKRKKFLVAATLLLASCMMHFMCLSIDCPGTSTLLNMRDTSWRPMPRSSTCTKWHHHRYYNGYWTSSDQPAFPHHPF